jgi:hypothetical protein
MVVMSPVDQGHYTITLVGLDGRSVAHATAADGDQKAVPFPGSAAAGSLSSMAGRGPQFIAYHDGLPSLPNAGVCCDAFLPTVSISDTRVYFPDGPTAVRYLGRDGSTGLATSLPNPTPKTRAVFSISPDDRRIAIGVFDWSGVGPMISIVSAQDLNGGGHSIEVERSLILYGWPVGWHGSNLVLARIPAFGGAPNPNAATAYSLVNPLTGESLADLGGMTCPVVGPLSRAGTACVAARCHCIIAADWSGNQNPTYTYAESNEMNWAALSPSGHAVLFSEIYGPKTGIAIWRDGSVTFKGNYSSGPNQWLDETHTIIRCQLGGCSTIEDLAGGTTLKVTLPGTIVGVLPGGL